MGIAAAVKLTPAVFLLFFLARKDFRASITLVVTAATSTLLGFLINAEASLDYWFGSGPAGGVSGSAFHTNQSIMGGLVRLELPTSVEMALWLALCAPLTVLALRTIRRVDAVLAMSVTGLLGLLVSPTSWSNHWVWVVPGVLVMLGYALSLRSCGWLSAAVVTTTIGVFGSFRLAPAEDPFSWTALHHVVGNAYLLLGMALLVALSKRAAVGAGDSGRDDELGPRGPTNAVPSR